MVWEGLFISLVESQSFSFLLDIEEKGAEKDEGPEDEGSKKDEDSEDFRFALLVPQTKHLVEPGLFSKVQEPQDHGAVPV